MLLLIWFIIWISFDTISWKIYVLFRQNNFSLGALFSWCKASSNSEFYWSSWLYQKPKSVTTRFIRKHFWIYFCLFSIIIFFIFHFTFFFFFFFFAFLAFFSRSTQNRLKMITLKAWKENLLNLPTFEIAVTWNK